MMATRSLRKRLWYAFLQTLFRTLGVALFQVRVRNRHFVPEVGGALILSNHQSNFDPPLMGMACNRRLNFLARKTLFGGGVIQFLIESLDAIPIDREGSGLGGLKETLKRLKRGEMVLIFPEGTRTPNGQVFPLKPGFCALARRAAVPLVPVAFEGAFTAWPRWQPLPQPAVIQIEFGPPLGPAEIARLDDKQLVAEMETRVRACHQRAVTYCRSAQDKRRK